ncbi:MAG: peptidylprolyl isomerase [Bacteroidales bacterium]
MYKKIFLSFSMILSLCIGNVKAQQNVIDEVVWVVGDQAILKSQIEEQRLRMLYEREEIKGDPYCVIPEQIALQKLFLHQASLDSINVPETQVLGEVERRMAYFTTEAGGKDKLEEYFGKPYAQIREEMKDMVRDQSVVQEVQRKLVGNIKITPAEVRRFFSKLPDDSIPFIPTQVEVQIVQLEPKVPQEEIDKIKERLRDYTNRVNEGSSSFSTLALLYSEDPGSAPKGGELGFMGKGQLVPEFANVAFNLTDPKRVSKIVESEFGYHIIQLIEKRGDRINVRHILLKPKVSDEAILQSINRLDSIRTDIVDGKFSFEEAAQYISQDKDTRNSQGLLVNPKTGTSKFEMQDLPQEIAKVVNDLQNGEISKPITMINAKQKEVTVIVKLKNRTEGHKANMAEDYQALKAIVEDSRRGDILEKWIRKKQHDTYIRIRDGYQNCDFQYPGWIKQ